MIDSNSSGAEPRFVFIIGAGRSGTTLMYRSLCLHPQVAWISNYIAKMPSMHWLAAINRITDIAPQTALRAWFDKGGNAFFTGRNMLLRFVPTPVEGEAVYAHCGIPLFPKPDWCISPQQVKCLRETFTRLAEMQKSKIFISKRTANNRRIPQLLQAFPDAKFIHIVRDGRFVARSLLKVSWWPDMKIWWLDQSTTKDWQQKGGNIIELAARTWVQEMQEINSGIKQVPSKQIMELHYESLVTDPLESLERVSQFVGLDNYQEWIKRTLNIKIYDGNKARMIDPNDTETRTMENIQSDMLKRYGYRCQSSCKKN